MLELDQRARREAAGHIVRNHTHAELLRILAERPTGAIADIIREHMARTDYRARLSHAWVARHKPKVL